MGTTKRERQKANRQQRLEQLAKTARKDKTRRTATLVSVVVVGGVLLLFGLSYLFSDDDDEPAAQTIPTTVPTTVDPASLTTVDENATTTTEGPTTTVAVPFAYGAGPCPAADGSSDLPDELEAPSKCIDDAKGYVAEVTGKRGAVPFDFEITLDSVKSPGNVNNFVTLARYGFYDGTDCHRIIKDFVVQCGRRNGDESAPGYSVNDELPAPDSYYEGAVVMANSGPNTNGSQFFIVTGPQGAALPPQYTMIGQVTRGYVGAVSLLEDAADPLAKNGVPPLFPVTIDSVKITELASPPETTVPTTTTTTTTTLPEATTASTVTGTDQATTGTADIPSATSRSTDTDAAPETTG